MKVSICFEDEYEFRAWWEERERERLAASVLGLRMMELRNITKHGEPSEADEREYDRLWELCKEAGLDAWPVMSDS